MSLSASCLLVALAAAPSSDGGVESRAEHWATLVAAQKAAPTPAERTATMRSYLESAWELGSSRCVQERSPESCDLALLDWIQRSELRRAEHAPSATRSISCNQDGGLELRGCLVGHFGEGTLVSGSNADFVYATPSDAGVRLRIGTHHLTELTLFLDEQDSSSTMRAVVENASRAIELSSEWESAPFGSERFIGFTEGDGGVLERETPAHGGFVVCTTGQRIEPLGDLIEVTVRGGGYHPEQDVQHVVFLYRAPCSGMVFGSGTNGLHVGRYAKRATAAVITKACSDTSCTLSMRLKGRVTDLALAHGAEAWDTGSLRPLGDLNRDGVTDYLLSWSDPGGGSNQLLNSTPSGWEAVAAQRYEQ